MVSLILNCHIGLKIYIVLNYVWEIFAEYLDETSLPVCPHFCQQVRYSYLKLISFLVWGNTPVHFQGS
jgi:hypothetical protein